MTGRVIVIGNQETTKLNLTHCRRCGKKFKQGDKIFSNLSRRYHFRCAEECNLIPEIS